ESRKAYSAWYQKKENQELQKKRSSLLKEMNKLVPPSTRKSGVWVYRQQGKRTPSEESSSQGG
ncbi:MAG: hypothetical protein QF752_06305, partial [Planctomycetota bacterium]|nr:hypothetical protein [Planctomycetota bacterium]